MTDDEFSRQTIGILEITEQLLAFPCSAYLGELRKKEAQFRFKARIANGSEQRTIKALRSIVELIDATKPKLMRPGRICREYIGPAAEFRDEPQTIQSTDDREPGQELLTHDKSSSENHQ